MHSFGHNNEPSVSIPCREFLQLIKKYSAQWRWPMLKFYDQKSNYFSPRFCTVKCSMVTRFVGHGAHKGEEKMYTKFWWRNLKERYHLQDLGLDGSLLLKLNFKTLDGMAWTP
jgi:endo-beta-N-acetylglucosaminidase D